MLLLYKNKLSTAVFKLLVIKYTEQESFSTVERVTDQNKKSDEKYFESISLQRYIIVDNTRKFGLRSKSRKDTNVCTILYVFRCFRSLSLNILCFFSGKRRLDATKRIST